MTTTSDSMTVTVTATDPAATTATATVPSSATAARGATLVGQGVSVRRGQRPILDAADVTIAPGQVTAILGPNGSGKSTLLRVLSGLMPRAGGEVQLAGAPLDRTPRREVARRLAFLPQDTRCDFAFTVEEVVAMGRHPHRGRFDPQRQTDRGAVEAALAQCDVTHLRLRTMDTLSGGERQRVAIARCLATEPDVILLDEPTAHLDLEHALAVLHLCRTLADDGKAVALATHDLATVSRWASHLVVLSRGRIVAQGAPALVLTPALCRDVFAVEAEILTTADGRSAFVFASPRVGEPLKSGASHRGVTA